MFIVFEGIDGTGKSTQVQMLAEALRQRGKEVITSKEPTDGPFGTKLRKSAITGRLPAEDELELFHQDRREHLKNLVNPALERGATVILDRYYFSTMAYQGCRGLDPNEIRRTNETFAPPPDYLFILEIGLDEALARIGIRDGQGNEFEKRENLKKCHEIFSSLTDDFISRIDASKPIEQVHLAVLAALEDSLSSDWAHPETRT